MMAVESVLKMDLLRIFLMKIMGHAFLEDVWCATFGNRRGGDPPLAARGGAGAISSIHIPIPYSDPYLDSTFTTTTQFILKCQDQPDNTTTCTSFPCPIPPSTCRDFIPSVSIHPQACHLTLVTLLTHACSLIKLLLIGDSGESRYSRGRRRTVLCGVELDTLATDH